MRALETGRLDQDDPRLREESSFCLGCRACEPVCPAGVQYGELLEEWRDHQWRGRHRPPLAQAAHAGGGADAGCCARWALVRRHARTKPRRPAERTPTSLMLGCFERGLYPGVSRAVRALLPDLAVPPDQGCCGALHAHNGESERGGELARQLGEQLPGIIVTTAGGCAAHLASVLGRRPGARAVRAPGRDRRGAGRRGDGWAVGGPGWRCRTPATCATACGVFAEPRALISAVAEFVPVAGDDSCCGAAGTYSLLRPRDSRRILEPQARRVRGRRRRLRRRGQPGLPAPAVDRACGGEAPSAPCTSPTCSSPRPAATRCREDGGGSFGEARGGDRARRARRRAGRPELPILVINASGVDPGEPSYALGLLMAVWFSAVAGTELLRRRVEARRNAARSPSR